MIWKLLLSVIVVAVMASTAWAQRPPMEIHLLADYVWTTSISATVPGEGTGDLDIKDNPAFGLAFDIGIRPGTELELFYFRQDSEVTFKQLGATEELFESATSYYHIGVLQGFPRGNVTPFTGLTLGATSFDAQGVAGVETTWKFSFAFNAGAKIYLGEAKRFGIRADGRMLATMTSSNAGFWVGQGGSVTIGGSAIWQWALGGSVFIAF